MMYKLGKLAAKQDYRTIQLSKILRALPPPPANFDVDSQYSSLTDSHMYKNDTLGDCVMAGRAHQTLRLEDYEQQVVIPISDNDVTTEYFKETGGADNGLVMIDSLNAWRQGWKVAGQNYDIYAYAQVDVNSKNQVMEAIYLLNGLYIGLELPISAQHQGIWDVTTGPDSTPGSWGGHCVYIVAYDADYLTCMTWGARKRMTWAFFQKYCDEAFGIVDDKDNASSTLDVNALSAILAEITGQPAPTPPPSTGTMALVVTPQNATITIDGSVLPGHPSSLSVYTGQHTVQASLSGYKTQKQVTYVMANTTSLVTINLVKSNLCVFR
jgi:hypothetical protein